MKKSNHKPTYSSHFDLIIMGFVFLILFGMPVIFTRINGVISWQHVIKIWIDQSLLIPLFFINHLLLVPRLLFRNKTPVYFICIITLILSFSFGFRYFEKSAFDHQKSETNRPANKPDPVPPYAGLLMYSLLIAGVDTGLLFTGKLHETEEKKHLLEKQNSDMQLEILRNQVSPHFFMNTLNNIYALIGCDTPKAREAVMKLSKLMRYMLYENENGRVFLSKEFEFIRSYVDLMRLRFADESVIKLSLPENYIDVKIPALLFISYIENAFKYGASYENECRIRISFAVENNELSFHCQNIKQKVTNNEKGGLGLENSKNRLNLLFGSDYKIKINSNTEVFSVDLKIPIV